MMNVQIMRHIVDEIEAGGMPGAAQRAAARWNGSAVRYVRSSANHIFHFLQEGQPRYLRLTPMTERKQDAIQAELDFILYVAATGLAVARPLPSVNGTLIEALHDGAYPYYAVVFEALHGQQFEVGDLDEPMYDGWGRALAWLHLASTTFPINPARPTLQHEIQAILKTLPPQESVVAKVLESGLAWLNTLPTHAYGLIHADFELDNLIWDGEQFQILDFDAAVYCWYAADITAALEDVLIGHGADRDMRLAWFFKGYSQVSPLPDGIPSMLPHFRSLLSAVKVARLLRAYATTGDEVYPEWLSKMRIRHQSWLDAKRAVLQAGFSLM